MEEGRFRPDLYYRLNSFTLKLPPLRDREDDKVLLARHFLAKIRGDDNGPRDFSDEALEAIRLHSWPGNIRELENKVRRGFLMATDEFIDPVSMELNNGNILLHIPNANLKECRSQKEIVAEVLEQNDYVVARAARELKISRPSMYALMKKYGISGRGN